MHRLLPAVFILAVAAPAIAQPDPERDRRQLADVAAEIAPAPGPGLAKATPQKPTWCATTKIEGTWTPHALGRSFGVGKVLEAAMIACQWANEPAIQPVVAAIVQQWINTTGLSEQRAIESLTARLVPATFAADKQRLCSALVVSDEVTGAERSFAVARAMLFGCPHSGHPRLDPMWQQPGATTPLDLAGYLDTAPADEIVRLALVLSRTRIAIPDTTPTDRSITSYAIDQIDYAALTPESLARALDAPPYRGNTYARVIAFETLGRATIAIATIVADVERRSKDEAWREILVTAPRRGIARWNELAAKHADAIRRSNDFEVAFSGPSASKAKGCWSALSADFVAVARTLDRSSAKAFEQDLADPVASLLLARLAACAAIDRDPRQATALFERAGEPVRGPRVAAYREALAALGAVVADRPRFPVSTFYRMEIGSPAHAASDIAQNKQGREAYVDDGSGDVKSVDKTADGVRVTFVRRAHKERVVDCVTTNRIVKIHGDGTIQYYMRCRDTGKTKTVVTTAEPIVIPAEWAGGIARGVRLEFVASQKRRALPLAVMKDGRLVNWLGLSL